MAIAYFIPDQAKLLARSAANMQQTGNMQQPSSQDSNTANQSHSRPQSSPTRPRQQQHQRTSSHFRANISVPLARQQGAMSMSGSSHEQQELGCWELLAQIFCYALRLYSYNSAQRTPTVIQISFEISSGVSSTTSRDADSSAADGVVTDAASPTKQN